MKKKIILPTLIVATTTLPSLSLVSCNQYEMSEMTREVIDEFRGNEELGIAGLNSVPRPSKTHQFILEYLKNRIVQITGCLSEEVNIDRAGNLYYDIPASDGYETNDTIIVQSHMDMVVAGMTEEEAKTKPIETVIDGDVIHSKEYKTSIGADNGIGVAISLYLLKHANDFNHGKIRLLFTADEDAGMIGASQMSAEWLKDNGSFIPWLINVDAEEKGIIYRCCCGNCRLEYAMSVDSTSLSGNCYQLNLDGLIGGHSASDIVKDRANADKLVFDFLDRLLSVSKIDNKSLQIVEYNHKRDSKDIMYSANQIIANGNLIFTSEYSKDQIEKFYTESIERWRQIYPGDNWNEITKKSFCRAYDEKMLKAIDAFEVEILIKLFGSQSLDVSKNPKSFYFGPLQFREPIEDKNPLVSCNIGPIDIKQDVEDKCLITANTSTRSGIGTEQSDEPLSINGLFRNYQAMAQEVGLNVTRGPTYYPWPLDEDNILVKYLSEGYEQQGITPIQYDDPAGVEPAWWSTLSEGNTKCACLGPTIDNAHSVMETLHLKDIDPVVNNIFYTIDKLITN